MPRARPHGDDPYRTGQAGPRGYVVCGARGRQRKHEGPGCPCGFTSPLLAAGDPCPCGDRAMPNGRCKVHGGKTPKGMALPQTTHGRYSTDLPTRLASSFDRMMEGSGEHVVLESELAVLRVHLADLLHRVDSGESGRLVANLQSAWREFSAANRANDADRMQAALADLGHLVTRAAADHAAWQDVGQTIERIRRLSETEQRRITSGQRSITEAQMVATLAVFTSAVREVVHDPAQLEAIRARFASGMTLMGVTLDE